MFKILLMSFLFSHVASAIEFQKQNSSLYMNAPCDEGNEVLQSLREWTRNSQTKKNCNVAFQRGGNQKTCKFNITNCVPDHVVDYYGANPDVDGPNCYNTALVLAKIIPAFRYSSPGEMYFYMRPPLCHQLRDNEKPLPGDIGAIRTESGRGAMAEVHGFVYISEKIAYSKNGGKKDAPYALQSLANVLREYDVDPSASNSNYINYFRCSTMQEYMEAHPGLPQDLQDAFRKMASAEKCFQRSLFLKEQGLSITANKNILEVSEVLSKYLSDAQELDGKCVSMQGMVALSLDMQECVETSKHLSKEERKFILGSLEMRLKSIKDQLGLIPKEQMSADMAEFSKNLRESLKFRKRR